MATELPILYIKQNKDTLYVTADTLYSAKIADLKRPLTKARDSIGIITDSSLNKYFEAFHNVKVYSDSLQAKCDSLFYALSDSTIRLLTNPIVWSNDNQISGDTIFMYLNNKKPERLQVLENAFAIEKVDTTTYYNQLKGSQLNAWFDQGSLSKMKTKGNAENIYYALDDEKKFVGVSRTSAQIIEIDSENNEVAKVKFINKLIGKMSPMSKIPKNDYTLKGFKWQSALRPKSKFEILSPSLTPNPALDKP